MKGATTGTGGTGDVGESAGYEGPYVSVQNMTPEWVSLFRFYFAFKCPLQRAATETSLGRFRANARFVEVELAVYN